MITNNQRTEPNVVLLKRKKEEMKSKIAALEKFLEEKDPHIWKVNAIIQEMKER